MTIEHNVVLVNGLEYKAVAGEHGICGNCVGFDNDNLCGELFKRCTNSDMNGTYGKIFKRHYRPTHKELQK